MTPWWLVDLALLVFCIGLVYLVGGAAMLVHSFTEDLDEELATEVFSHPGQPLSEARSLSGSAARDARQRFRIVRGRPGDRAKDASR